MTGRLAGRCGAAPPLTLRRRRWLRFAGGPFLRGPTRLSLVVALIGAMAGSAWSAETAIDGRLSLRGLFSAADGPQSPTVGIIFLETDIRGENLTSVGLRLVLDGTFVVDGTQANERRLFEDLDYASHDQRCFGYPYPIKAAHDRASMTKTERVALRKQVIDAAVRAGMRRSLFRDASRATGHG